MFLPIALSVAAVAALLVTWPVIAHPSLPVKTKRLLAPAMLLPIILCGVGVYLLVGIPQLAVL